MTYAGPALLNSEHRLEGFECGEPALDAWLMRRALGNQALGTSRTWIVTDEPSGVIVAYYASCTASVMRATAPKHIARDQPADLPAILLGRMAVDRRHQGRGLAGAMLKHFMTKAIEVSSSDWATSVALITTGVHIDPQHVSHRPAYELPWACGIAWQAWIGLRDKHGRKEDGHRNRGGYCRKQCGRTGRRRNSRQQRRAC